ncbi:GntR family transcriptional regulator [Pseudorhodoferax soli]|uniref:GntR family transcriptional regulator n=1 Tax=Pseudorhodoferax soli TaxID=545864 RepID=A0A368XZK3_9BURK|nr:GntR family transcriptional regulator [Pseudorhodoferax soli]RCW72869.1 GntR family transcriptional regulator [Pseudorhodoferax soli]
MKPSSQPRPVAKQSVENQTTDNLREFILSGAVRPGTRLTEVALADQMGVARATLRTGLQRLASEGIVVQIPYTGWQVADLSANDVWELWTLRASLESLAAKLAAQSTEPGVREHIAEAYENLLAACRRGNMKKIGDCDFALHRAIVESAGHSRLERQYQLVEQQVRLYIVTSNNVAEGPDDIVQQHRPMAEALLAGDAERAAHEAWQHSESEGKRLLDWLRRKSTA